MNDYTECFAIPGYTIIDLIDSETGRTQIYGKTLEECRSKTEHAKAERMTVAEFCQGKAKLQDSPITWHPTTEEDYWDMLGALPPAARMRGGFLCGEPYDHHAVTGESRHSCMREIDGAYYVASRPVTITEFRAVMQKGVDAC